MIGSLTQKVAAVFKDRLNLLGFLAAVSLILVSGFLYLTEPLFLQVLRNSLFDQYQRWQPREYKVQPVKIIDIDEQSLRKLGQWPWPRTRIAELISRLHTSEVAAIGFDIIFAEPDRTSPSAILGLWNLPPDARNAIKKLPDHDALMADELGKSRAIVGFSLEHNEQSGKIPRRPYSMVTIGESPLPFLHEFSGAVTSLAALEDKASGNGALIFVPDADGVVRRVPLLLNLKGKVFPSLIAETLRVAQGAGNYIVRTNHVEKAGIEQVGIGKLRIPTTPKAELWVHYSNPVADRTIAAWKIFAGEVPVESLKSNIVLVGTSAKGLMDLRVNTRGEIIPGVEVQAQVLEQILGGTYLARPAWAGSIEVLAIVIGGLILCVVTLAMRALVSSALALAMIGGAFASAWFAFSRHGLLLDPMVPSLCLLTIYILTSVIHHVSSERKQRWIRQAFSRYVSPNLVSHLVAHPGDLELGGHRQQCSFIFTDLVGFTSLIEKTDPADAVSMLNAYLDEMIAIAFRYEGTLDRIVGDAVASMFSAPVPQADHPRRALKCALEMQTFATKYAADLNARGIAFGQTRIGVHSGEVIVGNIGGSTIFDYRALGDTVNTAARLEGVNKHLGTKICVSEATLVGCPDVRARPIGRLVLKGKTQPVMIYEPDHSQAVAVAPHDEYSHAFDLMRDKDAAALESFKRLASRYPRDSLIAFHLHRLMTGETGDLIVMTEK